MELEYEECERLALDIIGSADKSGIHLRLLGAMAFRIHCPVHHNLQISMHRVLTDLDFAAYYNLVAHIAPRRCGRYKGKVERPFWYAEQNLLSREQAAELADEVVRLQVDGPAVVAQGLLVAL